jgi:hypothetical protein
VRTLPGGRGDTERMPKQPVPQPLRLAGLCLLVAAMGVLQRSLPAVLVAGFGRARHYRGNGGPNRLCFSAYRRSRRTGDGIVRSLCRTARA